MERLTRRDWSKYGFYDKETPILGARREYELYNRLGRYEDIGTLEECRAAVEKQTAKKVISFEYHNGTINYGCPVCKWKIISKINGEWCCGTFNEYCDRCGQKLDWSDEDEKI